MQISTAGKEASGTSNMKFALNGALTIGTLDGANVEIRDEVGHENFFLFGLTADEVARAAPQRLRPAARSSRAAPTLAEVLALIESGFFSFGEPERFRPILDSLRDHDPYMVCADFDDYVAAEARAAERLPRPARLVAPRAAQHRRRQPLLERRDHPPVRHARSGGCSRWRSSSGDLADSVP